LRILLLAPHPFFQQRGTPIAERALIEVLCALGHQVDVLAFHEGDDPRIPGCTVHRIERLPGVHGIRPGFSFKKLICDVALLFRCIGMVRKGRYDVIHAAEEAVFIALVMRRWFGIPYVYDMDSWLADQLVTALPPLRVVRPVLHWCERSAVRRSLAVVAVCPALADVARRYSADTRIATIEDPSLLGEPARDGERLADTIGHEGPIVLYVGNLKTYQGIDMLLRGFREARREHPDAQLVLIGGTPSAIRRRSSLARRLGVADSTHFVGPRPLSALGTYLAQATILVSPRINGINTPMKLYSYMDSGRPVLATRLPSHTQVLDDETGYLVDPTPSAFGSGLNTLLSDDALRRRLAERALERARREHSHEVFHAKVVRFYDWIEQQVGHGGAEAHGRTVPLDVMPPLPRPPFAGTRPPIRKGARASKPEAPGRQGSDTSPV
jgi:glycosyltransferase involved in cell wall biosynthesis